MTTSLVLQAVSVRRGRRLVLVDVDLSVSAGELLAVVGPNGSGKSTMLAVLAGDLAPTAGAALLRGRPLATWPVRDLARERSVVVQQGATALGFTAREVVAMGRAPWDEDPAWSQARVDAALAEVEAVPFANRPVHQLSGGERGRVDLARALVQDTPVVLLDEPTAALDLRHAHLAMATARRLADEGRSVVVVVHDLSLAGGYADRVALLQQGRLVATGSPEAVLTEQLLSAVFEHPVVVVPHPETGTPLVLSAPGSGVHGSYRRRMPSTTTAAGRSSTAGSSRGSSS